MKYQITILDYKPCKSFLIQAIRFAENNVQAHVLKFHTFRGSELYAKLFDYCEATIGPAVIMHPDDYCITIDEDLFWLTLDVESIKVKI